MGCGFHIVFAKRRIRRWKLRPIRVDSNDLPSVVSIRTQARGAVGVGTAAGLAAEVGAGAAVRGDTFPAATMAIRSTSIRYRGIPTNSMRSSARIAGPNWSLCLAKSGLLASGGKTSTVQSG